MTINPNSGFTPQELQYTKQYVVGNRDKLDKVETDVEYANSLPALYDDSSKSPVTGPLVFEHGLYDSKEIVIKIHTLPKEDENATLIFFNGQNIVAQASLSNIFSTNGRYLDFHIFKITDDDYHYEFASVVQYNALSQILQTSHIHGKFDKISLTPASGSFPNTTEFELYIK